MSNNLPSHGGTINSIDSSSSKNSLHNHLRNITGSTTSSNMPGNLHNPTSNHQPPSSQSSSSLTSSSNINGPLPDNEYEFPYCEDVNKYTKISKIGQGKCIAFESINSNIFI